MSRAEKTGQLGQFFTNPLSRILATLHFILLLFVWAERSQRAAFTDYHFSHESIWFQTLYLADLPSIQLAGWINSLILQMDVVQVYPELRLLGTIVLVLVTTFQWIVVGFVVWRMYGYLVRTRSVASRGE